MVLEDLDTPFREKQVLYQVMTSKIGVHFRAVKAQAD